jgi:acetylornithine deacetylase/succinyl-diaminopimelate desuccinylase-like protein
METRLTMSAPTPLDATLRDDVDHAEPWFRESLRTLVEYPTISPGGGHRDAIVEGVDAAAAAIRAAGGRAEVVETTGTPAVIGGFEHPRARTSILIYNHLDVQPADPEQWTRGEPFRMRVTEDAERHVVYHGRGTTDDKGPALCALAAARIVHALDLPIDVRFIWESEEEVGSPHFREVVAGHREALRADGVVVSDTIWPSATQPAISTGLRGALQAMLRLETARQQAHSGLVGGVARNPVRELCALATAIDGARFWREDVVPSDAREIASFAASGFDPDYFQEAHGLTKLETRVPLEMMLRLWARPTFEVHGLVGGYSGPGIMSTVPARAELKVSFRLVPDQDPERIAERLRAFVAAENPDVEVELLGRLRPYRADVGGALHGAIATAMGNAFGRDPVLVREGGSIGAVPILVEELGVPVHFLPLSLPEHGYHAPDECFDWRQARGGIEAFARTFETLATA